MVPPPIPNSTIYVGDAELNFAPPPVFMEDEDLYKAKMSLRDQIEQYFTIVAELLYESPDIQDNALKYLQTAKEMVDNLDNPHAPPNTELRFTLTRAQFEVRRVHVIVAKEQKFQSSEKRLRLLVPFLVFIYIGIIIGSIAYLGSKWTSTTEIAMIGVPVSVLLWAAIGSVAAMLYRFYTHGRGRIYDEIRWLIARPIIGIIMGALMYLVIVSGLFVFGNVFGTETVNGSPRPHLLWLLAFLGGFSDKFFESIIDVVAGRLNAKKSETKIEIEEK